MSERDLGAEAQAKRLEGAPRPGDLYQHSGGEHVIVLDIALHEATLERLVIYRSVPGGHVWARPLSNWLETVEVEGKAVPQFTEAHAVPPFEEDSPPWACPRCGGNEFELIQSVPGSGDRCVKCGAVTPY